MKMTPDFSVKVHDFVCKNTNLYLRFLKEVERTKSEAAREPFCNGI